MEKAGKLWPMHSSVLPAFLLIIVFLSILLPYHAQHTPKNTLHDHPKAATIMAQCHAMKTQVGLFSESLMRSRSDRFVYGTKPVLIKRAKIWTGANNGTEVIHGDILLDKGLIKSIGHLYGLQELYGSDLLVVDAKDAWVTPGIVDIHSHLGDFSSPSLDGTEDATSPHGTIQPWLKSLDGLNTHDDSYPLSIAGGVTTALVLPGSSNAIGGQAFVIKLRSTEERTPTSMLLEPPYDLNDTLLNPDLPLRWRYMKHACGENPRSSYQDSRMDVSWKFREAYKKAFDLKVKQDRYCSSALAGKWLGLGDFPQDLQWEALVDVIRGRVKLSNEFKFPIAAVHHASEAYLVPDLLKKTYGGTPAVALFATNSRYKREAYRSSEFASRILASHGVTTLFKSDHPIANSRYLLYEAQQAFYYGLPENLAIASVTSNAAKVMGIDHRVGYIKKGDSSVSDHFILVTKDNYWLGMDADLVIWDSHPLALGATPIQVFIDGIPQLQSAHVVRKPKAFQESPKVPNFDKEAAEVIKYEGLPPLAPAKPLPSTTVFTNLSSVYLPRDNSIEMIFSASSVSGPGAAVVHDGSVVCLGQQAQCLSILDTSKATFIDLEGGSIAPGLVSFGSPLGLQHIQEENSTNDGDVFDPFIGKGVPNIVGGNTAIVRAVDGLVFGSRDAYLAFRAGVTSAITAPTHKNFFSGLGVSFSLGATHGLEDGAVIQDVTGLHVTVRHFSKPSVSTQIAALRRLLLGQHDSAVGYWFNKVVEGEIPLVVEAHSADIVATLIVLKKEVEAQTGRALKLTITGAAEAHILAKELGEASVGVILNPPRPFPYVWEDRRILPGPPLTRDSAIVKLMEHGVTVGVGCEEIWSARNLPFDVAWAAIEAGGRISRSEALALGSVNVRKLLGVKVDAAKMDLVVTRGGELLDLYSKVVAVVSPSGTSQLL
ncbi:hypothetical protein C0995_007480 [Termitomyces sp. Mi166|nr:hypothetical protein C0995_007480 [Termitomyces sp. Mi166\